MFLARCVFFLVFWQAVSNLTAGVDLFWNPPTSGTPFGYNVYRSASSGTGYVLLNSQAVSTCSYTDDSAVPGNTYYYTVKSISQCGTESLASNELSVSVRPLLLNQDPTVQAGPNQNAKAGNRVVLNGTASDPDGDPLTYSWAQVTGPAVSLSDADKLSASFVVPQVDSRVSARFRLSASDGRGGTGSDELSVTFHPPNQRPKASAGADQRASGGQTVTLRGEANDPDGDPLTYSWSQIWGPDLGLTGLGSASITFPAPTERRTVRLGFELKATDTHGETATDRVEVTVRGERNVLNPFLAPAGISKAGHSFSNAYVGAALVNPTDSAREVSLSLVDKVGLERQKIVLAPLPPDGQRAFLPNSLERLDSPAAALLLGEDSVQLKGMFALGDRAMTRLDGISSNFAPTEQFFFPLMPRQPESALLSLFNAGEDRAEVRFRLRNGANGTVLKESLRLLPHHGTLLASPVDLFADDAIPSNSYIETESTQPLTGFQILGDDSTYSSLAAQPGVDTTELWLPHFVTGPDVGTTLRLLNCRTAGQVSITVAAYDDDGKPILVRSLVLEPGQIAVENLATFGTQIHNRNGYIKLAASQQGAAIPCLVGAVRFSGNQHAFASALSLQSRGQTKTVFPQIAQSVSQGIFTGVAILNPSTETSRVTVTSLLSDGTLHREISLALEPGTRVVDLLNGATFFGEAFEQINGCLVITSDLPVMTMMLWGDYQSSYLAAVEGHEVE